MSGNETLLHLFCAAETKKTVAVPIFYGRLISEK
jgi:hypothetical protein